MGMTGYAKIPDIEGESVRAEHEGEIEFNGLHLSVERAVESSSGRARGGSRAHISHLTMLKEVDKASPYLMLASFENRAFEDIEITARRDSGSGHIDYLVFKLKDCFISGVELENSGDSDEKPSSQIVREKVSIGFRQIDMIYTEQEDDLSAGAEHEISWDVATSA